MRGDFSRRTHDPRKHYSAVLLEQGRLLTDADLEEEHRIVSGLLETTAEDVIGECGAPIDAAGFAVTSPDGVNLALSAGRFYAAGTLLRNETQVNYTQQPDRITADVAWPPPPGLYVIVLDAWRRLITALDDPSIREVALGGPTTSVREKTVWQARHMAVDANWTCGQELPAPPTTTGTMAARAEPEAALPTPCLVPPLAGYTGLENQLYRVEVLSSGLAVNLANASVLAISSIPVGSINQVVVSAQAAATLNVGDVLEVIRTGPGSDPLDATFAQVASKSGTTITLTSRLPELEAGDAPALRRVTAAAMISRENGSVVTAIERIDGQEVTVRDLGPDDVLGFAPGQWVELSDDRIELEHRPRQLRQIEAIDVERLVVTLRTPATPLAGTADGVDPALHPKLRRWDAVRGIVFRANGTGWIHLESGIQVRFTSGQYVSGDYWQFPARAAIIDAASGNIEWPQAGGAPALLPPDGIAHHFCPVAVVDVTQDAGGTRHATVVSDCRNLFPPVTQLTTLLYVGGDGQEGRPGGAGLAPLPAPITVRVANGSRPVQGARVEFRITLGNGQLNGSPGPIVIVSNANGFTFANWALSVGTPAQTVEARLLTPGGAAIPHQLVRFHATMDEDTAAPDRRCCCVSIGPDGEFPTIEAALKELLEKGERDICLCLIPGDHQTDRLEFNGVEDDKAFHLSISGCGRATRVQSRGGILVDHGSSLRFTDFDLTFDVGSTLHTLDVDDVTLEGMHIQGVPPKVGIVRIHDASAVRVSDCVLEARAEGDIERLRTLFTGVRPLESVWESPQDLESALRARRAAREIDRLSASARRALTREIDRRITSESARLSAKVSAQLRQLSALIGAKSDPAAVAGAVGNLRAAIAQQSDMVALEIGAPDDLQEKLTDPSNVTPCTITIVDNEIAGNISLYGVAGGRSLNVDERALLDSRLKNRGVSSGMAGTVHIRDNRFNRLLLSMGILEALRQLAMGQVEALSTLYESLHVTNNVIDGANGQIAALHAVLTSNDYTLAGSSAPTGAVIVQEVLADTGVYTGNHGAVTTGAGGQAVIIEHTVRTSAAAANLELSIQ